MSIKKRNPAADILRILAFFSVVSVHFLLNNEFYSQAVVGKRMLAMVLMRALFIICVPLFLTLSGYLLSQKQVSVGYYKRIVPIILTYLLASAACIVYSKVVLHSEMGLDVIWKLLDFTAAPYSWYIEMYLGLFLIIPFLNVLYNNLPSQKWKIVLVLSFVVLTSLPSVVNVYAWTSAEWWASPTTVPAVINKLIPSWWTGLYPITYYFIGCYLKEYGLKIKKFLNAILIIACVVLSGLYSYWRSYAIAFVWGSWCGYESLFNVVLTTLVFAFFININYDKMPKAISWCLKKLSGLCLGAYLVSWIFDNLLYPKLRERVSAVTDRLEYYFIIVPIVFVLSLLLSYVLSKIQWLLEKGYQCIVRMVTKNKNNTLS